MIRGTPGWLHLGFVQLIAIVAACGHVGTTADASSPTHASGPVTVAIVVQPVFCGIAPSDGWICWTRLKTVTGAPALQILDGLKTLGPPQVNAACSESRADTKIALTVTMADGSRVTAVNSHRCSPDWSVVRRTGSAAGVPPASFLTTLSALLPATPPFP